MKGFPPDYNNRSWNKQHKINYTRLYNTGFQGKDSPESRGSNSGRISGITGRGGLSKSCAGAEKYRIVEGNNRPR
jgi:hypothetical protein